MTQNDGAIRGANSPGETMLCAPWVVFASGQGLRAEYGTTASNGIDAALEQEVSALCREFHNSLGVQEIPQEAPESPPVVLFWKSRQSPHRLVTQVLRAPGPPGQRIAYEYFSLALTETDLNNLGGNPLRALELIDVEALRKSCASGVLEPVCIALAESGSASATALPLSQQFSQDGTWPATAENLKALLAYVASGGAALRSFATWWPGARPPRSGIFNIVLRSDATQVARPHEILAIATELNQSLSRDLPAPPSYDAAGARTHRALLLDADEVQAMLGAAYFPEALEESPNRWMTRPQKAAGLCQKIADDLPNYASRLPAQFSAEVANRCIELASRYKEFASELQKLRHPNMLHQSRGTAAPGTATGTASYQPDSAPSAIRQGTQIALLLGGLVALGLLGFGVRSLVGQSHPRPHPATAGPPATMVAPHGTDERRDQQAIALMRVRAEQEVFRVARTLAAERANGGAALSKDMVNNTVVDAVAQAMSQTPQAQITPAQKRLLYRLATASVRVKALAGVRAGAKPRG